MISRQLTQTGNEAVIEEWNRGRLADPTLAPKGVPDLTVVPGYSLDDVRYNSAGLLSPAQAREAKRNLLRRLLGIGISGAVVALLLGHGVGFVAFIAMVIVVIRGFKALFDLQEVREGQVSKVQGDIAPELLRDSEGPDQYFLHIDELRLHITKQAYAAFTAGGPYRIYYLPGAKRAVGGQVLRGWRPLPQPKPTKTNWWRRVSIEL
jgi:hypothetical protein